MRTDSDKKSEYVSKILSYLGEGYPSPIGTKIRDIVEHEVEHRLKMGSVDVVRDSINALSGDWSRVMSDLSKAMAKEPSSTSHVARRIDDSTEDERLVASMHSFSKPKEQRLAEFEAYLAEADEDEPVVLVSARPVEAVVPPRIGVVARAARRLAAMVRDLKG